jgi:hypothetical protein
LDTTEHDGGGLEHDAAAPPAATPGRDRRPRRSTDATSPLLLGGIASAAAGLVHGVAAGAHDDLVGLARLFLLVAVGQLAVGVLALARTTARARSTALAVLAVNVAAVTGWLVTRFVGIERIAGLEQPAAPGLSDTLAAGLAFVACLTATATLARRETVAAPRFPLVGPAILVGVIMVPAMVSASSHRHDHGADHGSSSDAAGHDHAGDHGDDHAGDHGDDHGMAAGGPLGMVAAIVDGAAGHGHDEAHTEDHGDGHGDDHHGAGRDADATTVDTPTADDGHGEHGDHVAGAEWPRPWDPSQPFDLSGVPGVGFAHEARARALLEDTLLTLPRFADVTTIGELGFRSIGDERTGFEHFINTGYIGDDHFLDPEYPESLVFRVDGPEPTDRTLVSAMFIARDRAVDDPELVDYGGPLMQWHVHDNLCWGLDEQGVPKVMAVTDDTGGSCPPGTVLAGGENPMVHVWITPHLCGPFAALEGHGAGQVADGVGTRTDQCSHDH